MYQHIDISDQCTNGNLEIHLLWIKELEMQQQQHQHSAVRQNDKIHQRLQEEAEKKSPQYLAAELGPNL